VGSRGHWFHTIVMSRGELDRVFNNTAMKKRTKRFAILGMSLSNLLDINQPQDLLKGLLNTITEYDQSKEESDKPKMVCSSPLDLLLSLELYHCSAYSKLNWQNGKQRVAASQTTPSPTQKVPKPHTS
jgi:hypothetical protein